MAVARADARWCYLGWTARYREGRREVERFVFGSDDDPGWIRAVSRRSAWQTVPEGTLAPPGESGRLRTQVPIVPPPLRPRGALWRYHVLFEVEGWEAIPPRDPILLRRIRGDLFAVVAVWDLTEVERMVLATRS